MLHLGIGIGLVLGLGLGLLAAVTESEVLMIVAVGSAPLGTAFMSAVKMVIIPLVMAVISVALLSLEIPENWGVLGGLA